MTLQKAKAAREAFSAHRNVLQLSLIAAGLAGGLFLGAVKVAQSRFKDAKEDKKESPDDLRGCLHVIHGTVAGLKMVPVPPSGWLRITFHKVDGAVLEQSVHYVGSEDRGAGRRFMNGSRAFQRMRDGLSVFE